MQAPQRDHPHYYSGPVTFFRAPVLPPTAVPAGAVAVLGVPIDALILGRNGQRHGPRCIREASLYIAGYYGLQVEPGYVDIASGDVVTVPDDPRLFDVGDVPVIQSDLAAQTEAIVETVAGIVERAAVPVLLGGDHYVAYPGFEGFVRGLRRARGDRRVGYLHIDSHFDFWDEFKGMGRYHHGTCARRISENPALERMVFYGLNGTHIVEPNQLDVMIERGFTAYTVPSIRRRGPAEAMREALERVSEGVDDVYVSCDIDVVDGAYAPGTHSIVVAGMTSEEYLEAMAVIAEFDTVRALDLCETLPQYDTGGGRTSRIGVLGVLAAMGGRVLDRRPGYRPEQLAAVFR